MFVLKRGRRTSLLVVHFYAQMGTILFKGYICLLVKYVGRYFQPRYVLTFTVLIRFYLPEAAESAELPTLIRQPERYMALSTQNSWTTSTLVTGTESNKETNGIHLRIAYVTETFLTHPQSLDFTAFSKDLFYYLQGWSLICVSIFDGNLLGSQLWQAPYENSAAP